MMAVASARSLAHMVISCRHGPIRNMVLKSGSHVNEAEGEQRIISDSRVRSALPPLEVTSNKAKPELNTGPEG